MQDANIKLIRAGGEHMLDITFISVILIGFMALKHFTDWCGGQISKK